jgi:hypothetical protein
MTFTTVMGSLLIAGLLGPGAETLRQRRGYGQRGVPTLHGAAWPRRRTSAAAGTQAVGRGAPTRFAGSGLFRQADHAAPAQAVHGAPAGGAVEHLDAAVRRPMQQEARVRERVGFGLERARPASRHLVGSPPVPEEPDLPGQGPLLPVQRASLRPGCGRKPVEAGRERGAARGGMSTAAGARLRAPPPPVGVSAAPPTPA